MLRLRFCVCVLPLSFWPNIQSEHVRLCCMLLWRFVATSKPTFSKLFGEIFLNERFQVFFCETWSVSSRGCLSFGSVHKLLFHYIKIIIRYHFSCSYIRLLNKYYVQSQYTLVSFLKNPFFVQRGLHFSSNANNSLAEFAQHNINNRIFGSRFTI